MFKRWLNLVSHVVCSCWTVNRFLYSIHCGLTTFPSFFYPIKTPFTWISLKWRQRCLTWRLQVVWQLAKILTRWNHFLSGVWIFIFWRYSTSWTLEQNCWLSHGLNFKMKLFLGITKSDYVFHTQMLFLNKMHIFVIFLALLH